LLQGSEDLNFLWDEIKEKGKKKENVMELELFDRNEIFRCWDEISVGRDNGETLTGGAI
jgi:hypothetical protein